MKEMIGEIDMDKVWNEFERMTKEAEKVQKETLKRILEENASAEYLQSLGLNGKTDPESFKALVPVVEHKDLQSYIDRIVDGDVSSILTGKPISTISLTSGTTGGNQKFIPWNDELWETTFEIYQASFAYRNKEFPIQNGGKILNFIYSSQQFKTRGGMIVGTATTHIFSNPEYKPRMKALIHASPCSPDEVIFSPDFHQSLYCHLLCGLIFREEIQFIWATFAHSLISAFRTFEQIYEELCNDIVRSCTSRSSFELRGSQ